MGCDRRRGRRDRCRSSVPADPTVEKSPTALRDNLMLLVVMDSVELYTLPIYSTIERQAYLGVDC